MYASAARVSRLPQGCASATRVSRLPGATVLLSWMDGCFRDDGLSDMNGYVSFLQYGGVRIFRTMRAQYGAAKGRALLWIKGALSPFKKKNICEKIAGTARASSPVRP